MEYLTFSAPGRVELGGNHTDHQHGCVLAAAMPRTRAAVVFRSSCRGDRSSGASSTGAYPRENTRTTPSPVGRTRARAVRSMAAASTQPC